jgi:DNA primase
LNLYGRDFVVFPFCNGVGAPVAFQARALDNEPDGHRAYGRKSAGVFSTCADALKAETAIVCEAPIDALSLAMCGFPSVALGGTSAPDWMFSALAFKRVLLAFDNDANGAGDRAADKLVPALKSFGAKTARLAPQRVSDALKSDWNMMLLEQGAPVLHAWLVARLEHEEYFA